jgi:hypothetical protein
VDAAWSLPPYHPWDHPDWVLARAVAQAVIDLDEHLLISATRLDDLPLRVVADKIGISVPLAAAWRRKAERRLAEAIGKGELSGAVPRATFARNRDAQARNNGLWQPDATTPGQSGRDPAGPVSDRADQ